MAAGSAATMKAARDAAGYRQQVYQGNRCDVCWHCRPSRSPVHMTKYDRACLLHHVAVKTHGTCSKWRAA